MSSHPLRSRARATTLAVIAVLATLPAGSASALGQLPGDIGKLTVDDLRPPISPAFVLLGVEPATVQRPELPRAIGTTLLSLVSEQEGVPRNVAIEVAPFWLTSRPAFQFDDFYRGGVGRTAWRSLSLSAATVPRTLAADTTGTGVGFGGRALLIPGEASRQLLALRDSLVQALGECAAEEGEEVEKCYDALRPLRDSTKAHMQPVGWVLESAAAISAEFPGDVAERGHVRRVGVWVTPSYRWEGSVEAMLVGRYLHQRLEEGEPGNANLWDVGGRILWRASSLLALSAEGVVRLGRGGNSGDRDTGRYGALAEYRAADGMYVFYSIGKDFAASEFSDSRLLSIVGVNVGFGPKPVVTLPAQ